jgi:transposase
MARGNKLSEFEKGQIEAHSRDGKSNREIASLLGRSPRVINNYRRNPEVYGTRKSTGRPSKVSDRDKRRIFFSRRIFGGGSVMVWAAFTSTGRVKLAFVPKKMNSIQYQFVLERCLVPFYRRNPNRNFIFMQDNAPIHVNRTRRVRGVIRTGTLDWLQARNIPVLEWPPNSPDLNPIENLWGIMVRRIYAENKQYKSVKELKKAIVRAWHSVDQEIIDNLVLSMENRIFQVINRNGGPIDY